MGPDFSHTGEHGELPRDFQEWRRGLTYTVRPELLQPLPPKREVRLNVTVRHVAPTSGVPPAFTELYTRATTIMEARIGALRCEDRSAEPRSWIVAQAWFVNQLAGKSVFSASITSAASFLNDGHVAPAGEPRADAAALLVPGGGTPEAFAAKHLSDQGARPLDEIYIDFEDSDRARDVTISYGEYVASCDGVNYAPIVERAEGRARYCYQTLSASDDTVKRPFDVLRREWTCLSTGKAVDSTIATVHVYFRI
jgi:hypothetical protein